MPGLSGRALDAIEDGEFEVAGDLYTQAAYSCLEHDTMLSGSGYGIGEGLDNMLRAALCYRCAGEIGRCQNRTEQGVLIAQDVQEYVLTDERYVAVLQEFIADFYAFGNAKGRDQAYQDTIQMYEEADVAFSTSLNTWPPADKIIGFTMYLGKWASEPLPEDNLFAFDSVERVVYKRREMDTILATIGNEAKESTD